MQSTTNALDRMWERLDVLTDELLHPPMATPTLRSQALEVAWCIAGFYGGDLDWVREEAMRRRGQRERD